MTNQLTKGQEKYAERAGGVSSLEEKFGQLHNLDEALKVLKVATPEEISHDKIQSHTVSLINSALKNAPPNEQARAEIEKKIDLAQALLEKREPDKGTAQANQ